MSPAGPSVTKCCCGMSFSLPRAETVQMMSCAHRPVTSWFSRLSFFLFFFSYCIFFIFFYYCISLLRLFLFQIFFFFLPCNKRHKPSKQLKRALYLCSGLAPPSRCPWGAAALQGWQQTVDAHNEDNFPRASILWLNWPQAAAVDKV